MIKDHIWVTNPSKSGLKYDFIIFDLISFLSPELNVALKCKKGATNFSNVICRPKLIQKSKGAKWFSNWNAKVQQDRISFNFCKTIILAFFTFKSTNWNPACQGKQWFMISLFLINFNRQIGKNKSNYDPMAIQINIC